MLESARRAIQGFPRDADRLLVVLPAPEIDLPALAREASFFWDDPREPNALGAVARGACATLEAEGEDRFDEVRRAATALLARTAVWSHESLTTPASPRLFGGFAFADDARRDAPWRDFASASFVLPRASIERRAGRWTLRVVVERGEGDEPLREALAWLEAARAPEPVRTLPAKSAEGTSIEVWRATIASALQSLRDGTFEKVVPVLARKLHASGTLDVASALAELGRAYAECSRFAVRRGDFTLLGGSPERLFARVGSRVYADSLAGSAARSANDAATILELLASDKDRREHAIVVDAIVDALESLGAHIEAPGEPRVRSLRNVHHLWTPIEGALLGSTHALEIARVLHPTPAVCGAPRDPALRFIREREARGWYTGGVGWFDASGDGAFAVAIRSGVVRGDEAWLFAGAGVVEGSDADREHAETSLKLRPMLSALGIEP